MQKWHASSLKIILVAGIAVLLHFLLNRYHLNELLSFENLKRHEHSLRSFAQTHRLETWVSYLGIYIGITAFSLPGATLLTLAGGVLFGLLEGTILVSIASTLGATCAFLLARFLLRDWMQARFPQKLKRINEGVEKEGAFYLFTLRLVPAFPFFVVNVAMAFTSIRTVTFMWVSQLGMLPATLAYVNAGTQLSKLSSMREILSPGLILSFAILGILPLSLKKWVDVLRRRRKNRKFRKPTHYDYNLVVIGAGAGGLVSSYIAATLNAKVALIEKDRMGGDCLNRGCVPSKALIRSAKIAAEAKRAREFGIKTSGVQVELREVMERVSKVIREIEPHDSVQRYTALGVDCILGEAKVLSPYEIEVQTQAGTRILTTRNLILATGSSPRIPSIPGLEKISYYTSDTIWSLRQDPGRLLILGGGPIGCELAQAFQRLDVPVTLVQRGNQLLSREDPEAAEVIQKQFLKEGVEVLTGHEPVRFESNSAASSMICKTANGDEKTVVFDTLLLALGREARSTNSGFDELGLELNEKGMITCNAKMQTQYPNVYVCGDVAGPYLFTHVAAHQAWYASVNSLFRPIKSFASDDRVIPATTYVDPEVARVGLNEKDARKRNIPYEVTTYPISELDRAVTDGETLGFVKVLTRPATDQILGVTIVAAHAGEMLPEYITAMKHNLGLNKILGTIHTYPTFSEANRYAAAFWKKAHAPAMALRILKKYHDLRRNH